MIRQLGPPNFFVTLTSVEHLWQPLCKALEAISKKQQYKKIKTIGEKYFDFNIRKNPVLSSRYFFHRVNAFRKLMMRNKALFGKVIDYSFVTKFQNRGNEHVHFMLWIQDAPVYGKCRNE